MIPSQPAVFSRPSAPSPPGPRPPSPPPSARRYRSRPLTGQFGPHRRVQERPVRRQGLVPGEVALPAFAAPGASTTKCSGPPGDLPPVEGEVGPADDHVVDDRQEPRVDEAVGQQAGVAGPQEDLPVRLRVPPGRAIARPGRSVPGGRRPRCVPGGEPRPPARRPPWTCRCRGYRSAERPLPPVRCPPAPRSRSWSPAPSPVTPGHPVSSGRRPSGRPPVIGQRRCRELPGTGPRLPGEQPRRPTPTRHSTAAPRGPEETEKHALVRG